MLSRAVCSSGEHVCLCVSLYALSDLLRMLPQMKGCKSL
eukprot:COSAG06_NODE_19242_length_847_cov_1.037433_2_plen_38_part_01